MKKGRFKKQIEFLVEIDKLKSVIRQTTLVHCDRKENSAEHSWHLAAMTMVLSEYLDKTSDLLKVIEMVLIHDIVEITIGDKYFYSDNQEEKKAKENKAAQIVFRSLPKDQEKTFYETWYEFENGASREAKFARALDRVIPIMINAYNGGISWKTHNTSKDDVIKYNKPIVEDASTLLWEYVYNLIEEAEANKCFPE